MTAGTPSPRRGPSLDESVPAPSPSPGQQDLPGLDLPEPGSSRTVGTPAPQRQTSQPTPRPAGQTAEKTAGNTKNTTASTTAGKTAGNAAVRRRRRARLPRRWGYITWRAPGDQDARRGRTAGPRATEPQPGRQEDRKAVKVAVIRPSRATTTRSPYRSSRTRPAAPAPDPAAKPARAQVYEDHQLPPHARTAAWADLVDWVIWLHDAYELSIEERLPECWPHHPGLVRELAALRAWRMEIYTPAFDPATGKPLPAWGNGGSARAWHAELRNVIIAATTFYARGCRAGHRGAPSLLTGDEQARRDWITAQTPPLLPRGATPPTDSPAGPGRELDDRAMRGLLATGTARVLAPALPGYVHHAGAWWVTGTGQRWLEITDPALAARLDQAAATWQTAHRATSPAP